MLTAAIRNEALIWFDLTRVVNTVTLKKVMVEPPLSVPYLMTFCLARSSADSMGDCIRSTVRKAARLAVYEAIRISVKNHQIPPTIRVEAARGATSEPKGKDIWACNPCIAPQAAYRSRSDGVHVTDTARVLPVGRRLSLHPQTYLWPTSHTQPRSAV